MAAQHIPPSGGMGFHGHDSNYRRGLPTLRIPRKPTGQPKPAVKPEPEPEPQPEFEPEPELEPESEPEVEPKVEPDSDVKAGGVKAHTRQMEIAGGHFVYVDVTEQTPLFVVESDTPEVRTGLQVGDTLAAGDVAMMLYPMHNDSDGNVLMRTRTVNNADGTMRDFWALIQPAGADQTVANFRVVV